MGSISAMISSQATYFGSTPPKGLTLHIKSYIIHSVKCKLQHVLQQKVKIPKIISLRDNNQWVPICHMENKNCKPLGLYSLHETSWKTDMLICLYILQRSIIERMKPNNNPTNNCTTNLHPSHLHSQCTTWCMGIQHFNIQLYFPLQPLIIMYYEK